MKTQTEIDGKDMIYYSSCTQTTLTRGLRGDEKVTKKKKKYRYHIIRLVYDTLLCHMILVYLLAFCMG